jgi:hypothetical protein
MHSFWEDVHSNSKLNKWSLRENQERPFLEKNNCAYSQKALLEMVKYMNGSIHEDGVRLFLTEEEAKVKVGFRKELNEKNNFNFNGVKKELKYIKESSVRNPVVTKVVNSCIKLIKKLEEKYGTDVEYVIEVARDLKNSNSVKQKITEKNKNLEKINQLLQEYIPKMIPGSKPTQKNITKMKLFLELAGIEIEDYKKVLDAVKNHKDLKAKGLYSQRYINLNDCLDGSIIDVEHIIPKSRWYDDSFDNKTIDYKDVNNEKGKRTAKEFFDQKEIRVVIPKNISEKKKEFLTTNLEKLSFEKRQINDTSYIAKKFTHVLLSSGRNAFIISGRATSIVRNIELNQNGLRFSDALSEKYFPLFKQFDFHQRLKKTKRDDNRHHALDAIVLCLFDDKLKRMVEKPVYKWQENETIGYLTNIKNHVLNNYIITKDVEKFLEDEIVSALSRSIVNITKKKKPITKNGKQIIPRGSLFKENIYGETVIDGRVVYTQNIKLTSFFFSDIKSIIDKPFKEYLLNTIKENTISVEFKDGFSVEEDLHSKLLKYSTNKNLFEYKEGKLFLVWMNKKIPFNYKGRKRVKCELVMEDPIIPKNLRDLPGGKRKRLYRFNTKLFNEYTKVEGGYDLNVVTMLSNVENYGSADKKRFDFKLDVGDYIVLGYTKEEIEQQIKEGDLKYLKEDKLFYITEVGKELLFRHHHVPTGGKVKFQNMNKGGEVEIKEAKGYYMKKSISALLKTYNHMTIVKVDLNNVKQILTCSYEEKIKKSSKKPSKQQ